MYKVIDLFAGPGGLGEGFSSYYDNNGCNIFKIKLSIEKDDHAHETLELRSFLRQFPENEVPEDYYKLLRGEISRENLFNKYKKQSNAAMEEAWLAELGETSDKIVDVKIRKALGKDKQQWVLIGGPPCQAYSNIGRSSPGKTNPVHSELDKKDKRVFLYKEYLKIISKHRPTIFIMENVKGILSGKIGGKNIFDLIISDLHNPSQILNKKNHKGRYKLFPLVNYKNEKNSSQNNIISPKDFVIKSENHGIPQKRHRVIILGIREDLISNDFQPDLIKQRGQINLNQVLAGIPRLRSHISSKDTYESWYKNIKDIPSSKWFKQLKEKDPLVSKRILKKITKIHKTNINYGAEFIFNKRYNKTTLKFAHDWFHDNNLDGMVNHTSKSHMLSDIHRYIFVSCFALVKRRNPKLNDFPEDLLPKHKNVEESIKTKKFTDRFHVQRYCTPATTITSHIAKDGHYYIHPDPTQCRALTVREAARIQTFPDNYFFCGPRTEQYRQVGNAVPPLLAIQIAGIVHDILKKV